MKRFQETADLLSVVQTCRRQERSVLEFFQAAMIAHSPGGEFSPSLLPEPIPCIRIKGLSPSHKNPAIESNI